MRIHVWPVVALLFVTPALAAAQSATTPADPPPAAAPATGPTIDLGGYVQAELNAGAQGDTRFPVNDRIFLRRARVTVSGTILPSLRYRIQTDFAGGLGASQAIRAALTDGYIEWTKYAFAHIRVGQFKAPFGAEWLVPSTRLVTVERTLMSDRLSLNRQVGVQVSGTGVRGRLGYAAALFDGNGFNTNVNDNNRFMYVLRGTAVAWRSAGGALWRLGADAYWSTDTNLSLSGDFGLDPTPATLAANNLFTGRRTGVGVDSHFEDGVWRLDAEYLHLRFTPQNGVPQPDVLSHGWFVAPGAFVYRRLVQIIGRYERFRPTEVTAGNETREWLAGVNYYVRGRTAKLMVDYLWVDAPNDPGQHQKVLAQMQVVF